MVLFISYLVFLCLCFLARINGKEIKWCAQSDFEFEKCDWLKDMVASKEYSPDYINIVECVQASDKYACLEKIEQGTADVTHLDSGTAYFASINFVSSLLVKESYGNNVFSYYSVAVVPKSSDVFSAVKLGDKRLCSTGVGDIAGWTLPLSKLSEFEILPVSTCNVNVKTAAEFFSSMCAPGSLNNYHNPFGDNPLSTCSQCGSTEEKRCSYNDMYAGGDGAMLCLKESSGDVAFMRSVDLDYLTTSQYGRPAQYRKDDYELLCPQGGRRPIGEYALCNWGEAPADVIVTSGSRSQDTQTLYRDFLVRLSDDFPPLANPAAPSPTPTSSPDTPDSNVTTQPTVMTRAPGSDDPFTLFNTNATYGLNSLVSSSAKALLQETRGLAEFIDIEWYERRLELLQSCPIETVRLCVISEYELRKCEQLLLALRSKRVQPQLDCILDNSTRDCIRKIEQGDADIIVLDAGDVYEAGRYHNLVPFANENYGDTGNYYYAVAVSKQTESHLTLFNLIARNSCHGAMRSASGWIYPVLSLIETGQISPGHCDAIKKVGELFRRSCVPGILDSEYNSANTNPINLCENCAAGGMDKCQRNTRELYYGDSGAFRCLVENGGEIAFTRHMTPRDNTDGRNEDHWARNRRSDDYELLCKNGRRAPINEWQNCYLAKIPARAVVTATYKTEEERTIFWNLLHYAQQFYASDSNPYFTLFDSGVGQDDLIFSDSTVRIVQIAPSNQTYDAYLGVPFLKAVNTLNQFDCTSSANGIYAHAFICLFCTFLLFIL